MIPSWELVKRDIFLVVPTPGDGKDLVGLASFDLEFDDVTCKPAIGLAMSKAPFMVVKKERW